MKIKKLLSLFLLSSLLSCSVQSNQSCIYFYDENDTFIKELSTNIISIFNKQNMELKVHFSEKSQNVQNQQLLKDMEQKDNQVFIVNLVDRLAAGTIIDKVKKKNKNVLFFNREPLEEDLLSYSNCYYVGSDASYEGLLQAEMAMDLFGGNPASLLKKYDKNQDNKIQLVIIKGELGHQDAENRTSSALNGFISNGYQIDLLSSVHCNWSKEIAYEEIQSVYENYGDSIELLLANNDDMALGAIQYFLEQNIFLENVPVSEQPFPVIGVDATSVGLQAIQQGLLYGTVKNDAAAQAQVIQTLTTYLLENKPLDKNFPFSINENNTIYIKGEKILN